MKAGCGIASRWALISARFTLALSILLFVPWLFEQFEMPKVAVVQIVGLSWLIILASAGPRSIRMGPLDVAALVWLAVEVMATILSTSPVLSVVGDAQQHTGLLTTLGLGGIYFALRFGTAGTGGGGQRSVADTARRSYDIVLGAMVLACLYALVQAGGLDPIRWLRTAGYGPLTRPFGTMGHPNLLGVMSAACTAFALSAAMHSGCRPWLYTLAATLFGATTVLTFSRGAWLGLVAAVTVATVLTWNQRARIRPSRGRLPRWPRWLGQAGALALVVALLVLLATFRGELLRQRFSDLLRPRGGSAASRVEIWRTSLAAWRARPWLGHGPDTFELVFPRYQTASYWKYEWTGLPFHAHSIYLHTLATRGVIGFALGLGSLLAFAWTARRVWASNGPGKSLVPRVVGSCCAVGVAGAFGAIGVAGWLFLLLASAILASLAGSERGNAQKAERGGLQGAGAGQRGEIGGVPGGAAPASRRSFAWFAGGITAGAACLWWATEVAASRAAAGARVALRHDAVMADASATRAVQIRPFADWAHRLRAETLVARATSADTSASVLHQAVASARRAAEIEPERNLNHYRLAQTLLALAARGDLEASRQAATSFRRCLEISPVDAVSMLELARLDLQAGSHASALELSNRAVALYPGEGATQSLLAVALLRVGRSEEARRALERAVAGEWHGNDEALQTARELLRSLP